MLTSLLLLLPLAQGYTLNERYWDHDYPSEEPFELNVASFPSELVDSSALTDFYRLGLDIWNTQGDARIHLTYGGETTDTQYGDGNNDHNTTMYQAFYEGTALAKARHNAIGGALTDCDIAFYGENLNGVIPWSFAADGGIEGTYDFAHTVVHEMGHCVGIGHSEFEEAVMYSSSTKGSGWEKRDLSTDDIEAIQAIYGTASISLAIDAWTLQDADGDNTLSAGEEGTIVVTVRNTGNAHAYDVDGRLSSSHPGLGIQESTSLFPLGDLAPGATKGDLADQLTFSVKAASDCLPTAPVPLELLVFDAHQNAITTTIDVEVACPFPFQNAAASAGCGCSSQRQTSAFGLLLFPLFGLFRRRKLLE